MKNDSTANRTNKYKQFKHQRKGLWLISFLLLLITSCLKNEPSLIAHYYRYSGDYEGWNVWVWAADPPGNGKNFYFDLDKPDKDGFVTAKIFLDNTNIKEIGVIIRKSTNDNEWADKDSVNDRYTKEKEIWLLQNDPKVYTDKPDNSKPPILFAAADSSDKVIFTLPIEADDYSVFSVLENGVKLNGKSEKLRIKNEELGFSGDGLIRVIVTLNEKIRDPSKLFVIRDESGFFAERKVLMRAILDDFYYPENDLGVRYKTTESVFKVWSPAASAVCVALYDDSGVYNSAGRVTNHETNNLHPMEKDLNTGVWSAVVKGNMEGKFYLYRVEFAGGNITWAADPYAKAVSANGQRMAIIDFSKTNPHEWKENPKPSFLSGEWQDAIIYELHVRDFSININSGMKHKGKYLAFTERGTKTNGGSSTGIDHLIKLGITHVHLLPVFDFASINELTADDIFSKDQKFNWGYDPMHYNVPEGSYSTDPKNPYARITEFKKMVQSLHAAGIRVIMDVVYNHTYQTGAAPFDSIVPFYYYRTTDTGMYANGSGCGNETASERPMVRKFIIDSCRYWASEYNIDGFRFDLMGLIDTPTMIQLTEELRGGVDPSLIIYGEPWHAGGTILPEKLQTGIGSQKGNGFAVFNDRIRMAIKGGSDDNSLGFVSGDTGREEGIVLGVMGSVNDFTSQANESINYVTAHDNLNLWDKMALSHGSNDLASSPYKLLDGKNNIFDSNIVKSVILANGIILTSQGIPFFQAGDEFLRSKFGDHNSYTSPDNINMIRWENADRYREIIDYYAGLIRLRKEFPAFRQTRKEDIENSIEILKAGDMGVSFVIKEQRLNREPGISIRRTENDEKYTHFFIAYNADNKPMTFDLPSDVRNWKQLVNSKRAGIETLAEFSGSVTLDALSMTVLAGMR